VFLWLVNADIPAAAVMRQLIDATAKKKNHQPGPGCGLALPSYRMGIFFS
jgi:hypothetical protein